MGLGYPLVARQLLNRGYRIGDGGHGVRSARKRHLDVARHPTGLRPSANHPVSHTPATSVPLPSEERRQRWQQPVKPIDCSFPTTP